MPALRATVAFALCATFAGCASRDREIAHLPRQTFAPSAATPADWQRIESRGVAGAPRFVFFLPPHCVRDQPAEPLFVHGGLRWKCGAMGVEIVWGMWGTESFGANDSAHRATLAGLPVAVFSRTAESEQRLVVWYLTGGVHEPILSAWSAEPSDAPLLTAVTRSGLNVKAPSP